MSKKHKRALDESFLKDFSKGHILFPLLNLVKNDHTLDMELRGDAVEIYYRGGLLYRITKNKGNGNYEITYTKEYILDKNTQGSGVINSVTNAVDEVANHKQYMDFYFSRYPKLEREYQQIIVRENNYSGVVSHASDYFILDIEYAFNENSKTDNINARFDMLAVKWLSTGIERKNVKNLPVAFIEVKFGDGAVSGSAGICKHIRDYITFRKDNVKMEQLATDMETVFCQKHKLGLIKAYEGKELEISIDPDKVEYIFVFANHDPDKSRLLEEMKAAIATWKKPDTEKYLKEIKVAKASEMGYGLFAYKKGKEYLYPTIEEYVNALENNVKSELQTSEELDLSIDNYISDEFSICREERQYALYLSNVLRYYGKNPNKNRIDNEKIKNIFIACGFNEKDVENIVIENVFYEATFMRDFFERNRRIGLSDSPKTKCLQKTFTPSSYIISNKEKSFNRKLLSFCWMKTGHPKTKEEEIDFNKLELYEFNYGQNDLPGRFIAIKNLTRAMMNSKPDLAVIYRDSKSDKREKLLFLECKFDSGEDKVSGDEGTDDYTQTAIQGYIAEFLCKYYLDIDVSNIMEDPKNSGKYCSRKIQFKRKVKEAATELTVIDDNGEGANNYIDISSLIDLESEIFNK